ncbi:MAG: carbohydrate kinase family protein [Actinomycetota bacterium]|nr:carbohydrate kinase family protein [Actinomycetota bacterium]
MPSRPARRDGPPSGEGRAGPTPAPTPAPTGPDEPSGPDLLCTFGDAAMDVVVELSRLPVADDDVPGGITLSAGGQAANVAAWYVALGGRARLVTRLGDDRAGSLVSTMLADAGVEVVGARGGRTGIVASMVTPDGKRSMVSDRGAGADLAGLEVEDAWFERSAWLHLSGYALFGEHSSSVAITAGERARRAGAVVSVDLSSAVLVAAVGRAAVRRAVEACGATLVFANAAEHAAAGPLAVDQAVVKLGAAGYVLIDGEGEHRSDALRAATVRDTTGAGDAFAAGWLLGGPALALEAARTCVATVGAMPPAPVGAGATGTAR